MGTAAWQPPARNPLPPSRASPPAGEASLASPPQSESSPTHLLLFSVFSPWRTLVRTRSNPPQTQQPTLRLVSRRRIGGKIIKSLLCGQRGRVSVQRGAEETNTRHTGDETLLYAHSWQEMQRGGPRTRKQHLTETKHEKRGRRSLICGLLQFYSPTDLATFFLPTH